MLKLTAVGNKENVVVQSTSLDSSSKGNKKSESAAQRSVMAGGLIAYILRNPAGFVSQPRDALKFFNDSDFAAAHAFFSEQNLDRYVFSVSTALFHGRYPKIDLQLYASGMTEYRQSRFWPFWYANDMNSLAAKTIEKVENYLIGLWNGPKEEHRTTEMFYQTGKLEIEERHQIGELFFFKCALPVPRSIGKKPDTVTFVFDSETLGFYTINARVRCEESEHRFRFVEFIEPKLNPPEMQKFVTKTELRKWRVLFILDRHIGDNLSLLSTHIAYLLKLPQFDLTVDASMCPLFHKTPREIFSRFFPRTDVKFLQKLPPNRADYDLVFDPYDWLAEMFDLKPQNDSCAVSFVSGLEFARCCLNKKRRDILDMHMNSLKRMGIVSHSEPIPEFVRYKITKNERDFIRKKTRAGVLSDCPRKQTAKIVSIFPYGIAADRRYPFQELQTVINALLLDPDIHIVIAGTDFDTPELILTMRGDWLNASKDRIRILFNEPLASLIDLMIASDLVVSMDSGPLHLARSLRIQPIGLYSDKVNDEELLMLFPWLVEDGTADVLKPNPKDAHVNPAVLVSAIQKRLKLRSAN